MPITHLVEHSLGYKAIYLVIKDLNLLITQLQKALSPKYLGKVSSWTWTIFTAKYNLFFSTEIQHYRIFLLEKVNFNLNNFYVRFFQKQKGNLLRITIAPISSFLSFYYPWFLNHSKISEHITVTRIKVHIMYIYIYIYQNTF